MNGTFAQVVSRMTLFNAVTAENCEFNVEEFALISIETPGRGPGNMPVTNKDWADVLVLQFHDVGVRDNDEFEGRISPNEEHAKQIVEFVRKNKDKDFIVHCDAGISRSAAVGKFIEHLGFHVQFENGKHFANPTLERLLFNALEKF